MVSVERQYQDEIDELKAYIKFLETTAKQSLAALDYGYRLICNRKGEGDFSPSQFLNLAYEAMRELHKIEEY